MVKLSFCDKDGKTAPCQMLIGEYQYKITEGSRLAIPKKFREELGDLLIITRGFEGSLVIVNKTQFEKLTVGLVDKPFILGDARETTRFLLAGAVEVELDRQGRFVLPQNLQNEAQIKEEVVFLGLLRWAEIWDITCWSKHKELLDKRSVDIANRLVNLDK